MEYTVINKCSPPNCGRGLYKLLEDVFHRLTCNTDYPIRLNYLNDMHSKCNYIKMTFDVRAKTKNLSAP